jgi:hypothetical protein
MLEKGKKELKIVLLVVAFELLWLVLALFLAPHGQWSSPSAYGNTFLV